MMRLLFIAVPEVFLLPFEQYLLKKGYEIFIAVSFEEAKTHLNSGTFDTYIIEPYTNSEIGSFVIKQLKEWKALNRAILLLPGNYPNEEISARKIVGENFITLKDSFAFTEEKIVQIISKQRQNLNFPIFLHKPIIQYIKNEIEKAKRGHTSLSFIYYRLQESILNNNETFAILHKVNISVNYRLRISDDAFLFQKGILIMLFGTPVQDRYIIANAIQKRILRTLKTNNIEFATFFDLAEATYPDDGNSYNDIVHILDNKVGAKSAFEKENPQHVISELFSNFMNHQDLFRQKRKLKEIDTAETRTFLNASYLPPTWHGTLMQLCMEETTTPRIIEDFINNECNISERLMQISCGFINLFPERYKTDQIAIPQSLKEACLILGFNEFKNLISFCTIENTILASGLVDLSVLKEFIYTQMATAIELSKKLDYQNKSELLLCSFSQAIGYILIKRKSPEKFYEVYEKQNSSGKPIGALFLKELNFTPSELSWLFLNVWGIDEALIESACCARYENTPQLNPQLTAIIHLSIVITNSISGLGNEQNLKIAKISYDEILLRNRSFKANSINYLSDNFNSWLLEYNFIFN